MGNTILAVFHDNSLDSGATKSFLSNVEYMHTSGNHIITVVPRKEGNLAEYLETKGINTLKISYGGNVYSPNKNKLLTFKNYFRCFVKSMISHYNAIKLSKRIKGMGINCVYSNTSTVYFGAWIAQRLKINHYWHFREFCLEDQNSIRIWKKHFVSLGEKASKIFTISNVIDEYYIANYGFKNTLMVYNDISSSYINLEKQPHECINILVTGTICKEKGQEYAIKMIEKINNPSINLYIAGRNNEHAKKLMEYVKNAHLENVTFCGLVKDMRSLRMKMDFSLVCAKKEAFGRTIIEDMLAGILVLGCDTGAVTELIKDGESGFIYKYGDIDDMKAKIEKALDNKNGIDQIRNNAFQFALSFTEKRTAVYVGGIINGDSERNNNNYIVTRVDDRV